MCDTGSGKPEVNKAKAASVDVVMCTEVKSVSSGR